MTVAEIIDALKKFPQDAEDTVDCIEIENGQVQMMGYIDYARKQRIAKQ